MIKGLFLLMLLFAFPLGEIARFQITQSVWITACDMVVFLLVSVWCIQKIRQKNNSFRTYSFGKHIGFFVIAATLSLLINTPWLATNELLVASMYLVRWIFYAGLYFVVYDLSGGLKQKLQWVLVISGLLLVILGLLQFLLYPALRNLLYLGWDEHYYRLFSSFFDPNFFGAFLVLFFVFLFHFENLKQKQKILWISLLIVVLMALFLTFSRSAYLMFGVACFVSLFIQHKKRFVYAFLIPLVLFGIVLLLPRTEGTDLLRTESAQARLGSSLTALQIFTQHPVFGVGFNAYRYAQRDAGLVSADWQENHAGAGADNSWLFVLATTGIVGFVAFVSLFWAIGKKAYQTHALVVLISISALSIDAFFINSLFYPFLMLWFWIQVGLIQNR